MEEKKDNILDLGKILSMLQKEWKMYVLCSICVIIFSLIFVFTIPRYYTCKVMLAPEATNSSGLNSLMSSFGFGEADQTDDAISPKLYPDLISSNDFVVSLFPVEITTLDGETKTDYYHYLLKHNKGAWYMEALGKAIKAMKPKDDISTSGTEGMDIPAAFILSDEQHEIAEAISGNINCDYDKKTGVISITVKDADPLVCALIADTVSNKLQDFILDYRTKKARKDLEYTQRIYLQAKQEYEESNELYVNAIDANWDIVNETVKAQQQTLNNDKTLKYQTFSAVTQKLQAAKAKLQEATPVITVLQGSFVPRKPAGPKRVFITLALMFVAYVGLSICIIIKNKEA